MKKKKIKVIIILLLINVLLSGYNLITNIRQSKDIEFNNRLFDVFLEL